MDNIIKIQSVCVCKFSVNKLIYVNATSDLHLLGIYSITIMKVKMIFANGNNIAPASAAYSLPFFLLHYKSMNPILNCFISSFVSILFCVHLLLIVRFRVLLILVCFTCAFYFLFAVLKNQGIYFICFL